ncbi:MAG: DUF1492 domain-containing protein [Ruminococcus sp.]|nr:DUF1492 domain-containing protein [Ruminococcus sp.]
MTPKEYLEQAIYLDQRINSKLTQTENLRSLTTKVTTVYSDTPHNPAPDCQRLEKTIAKIIDLENDINKDIDKLIDLKKEITETINEIPDLRHRTILEMRYLSFRTWEQIAVALSLDLRWVHRLHSKGLQKIKIDH